MLNKQTTLYFYRGASSSIDFDFSEFTFESGGVCEFTISSIYEDNNLLQFKFDHRQKYTMVVSDEFTKTLKDNKYRYNIMYVIGNERYPQCADSDIIVKDIANGTRNTN